MDRIELFSGCFLGLSLGDTLGAPHEGGILERALWRLIGKTRTGKSRYTDDTQMSLDVAESLCKNQGINQDHLAQTFASSYRWSRGYGTGAAKMLKKVKKGANWREVNCSIYPAGSFGNGAAMRAPIVALYYYGNNTNITHGVNKVSEITHAHPLAIEGAKLVGLATSFAISQANFDGLFSSLLRDSKFEEYQARLGIARHWIENKKAVESKKVVKKLGNGIAAIDSCVTAIYIASRHINLPFENMLKFTRKCSGDTDTIGAMAGAIWGAHNGIKKLPQSDIKNLESATQIRQLSEKLFNEHLTNNSFKQGTTVTS